MDKIFFFLLCGFVAVMPPLALFSAKAIVPLSIILAIIPAIRAVQTRRFFLLWNSQIKEVALIFMAYGLLSSSWSIHPASAASLAIRLTLLAVLLLSILYYTGKLQILQRRRVSVYAMYGIIAALVLANIEYYTGGIITKILHSRDAGFVFNLSQLNRGLALVSVWIWMPLAFLLSQGRWRIAVLLLLSSAITIFPMESLSGTVAIIVGVIAAALLYGLKNKAVSLIALGIILITIITPVFFKTTQPQWLEKELHGIPASATDRLYIWKFAAEKAAEHPIQGQGFDATGDLLIGQKELAILDGHSVPLHPHNYILQLWLELGIAGLIIGTVLLVLICRQIYSFNESIHLKAAAATTLVAFLVVAMTGYGIWQEWWITTGVISAILIKMLREK